MGIPIFAILESNNNNHMDSSLETDDIIFSPFEHEEISARIRRVLWKHGEWDLGQLIRIGDLVIDQDKYEVSVARNKVILTFKEYQLLCLLASNPGRVYSREKYIRGDKGTKVYLRLIRQDIKKQTELNIILVRQVIQLEDRVTKSDMMDYIKNRENPPTAQESRNCAARAEKGKFDQQ